MLIFGKFGFGHGRRRRGLRHRARHLGVGFLWAVPVFQKKHESEYRVRSGWRYDADLMKRTLKFGVPSGLWALEGLAFSIFSCSSGA